MSASAPQYPAASLEPLERFGLQVAELPAGTELAPRADAAAPPTLLGMAAFHWTLLAGFALLEYAYLQALYVLACSALRHLIGD